MSEYLQRYTEDGLIYDPERRVVDKFIPAEKQEDMWFFTILNPRAPFSSYSRKLFDVQERPLDDGRTIYFDSDYFLVMAIDRDLMAHVGFSHNGVETRFLIENLQGKRYRPRQLEKLRWDKLLLALVCDDLFRYTSCQMVTVHRKNVPLDRDKETRIRYGTTPHRLGFRDNGMNEMRIYRSTWIARWWREFGHYDPVH